MGWLHVGLRGRGLGSLHRRRMTLNALLGSPPHRCTSPRARSAAGPTRRPNFGALSPALRQRPGGKELRYHRVQVAYRTLLAQVSRHHPCTWTRSGVPGQLASS